MIHLGLPGSSPPDSHERQAAHPGFVSYPAAFAGTAPYCAVFEAVRSIYD